MQNEQNSKAKDSVSVARKQDTFPEIVLQDQGNQPTFKKEKLGRFFRKTKKTFLKKKKPKKTRKKNSSRSRLSKETTLKRIFNQANKSNA